MMQMSVANSKNIQSKNDIERVGNMIKNITEKTKQKFDHIDREMEEPEIKTFIPLD